VVSRVALCILSAGLVSLASCGGGELPISAQVLVDGAPMDSGTLRFDPVDGTGKGAGGMVEAGALELPDDHGLHSGTYRVSATAFKKTGKTIDDYQRGKVEEMIQLTLKDSPREIELSPENVGNLSIEFTSTAQQ
jgi:hypothetical protein